MKRRTAIIILLLITMLSSIAGARSFASAPQSHQVDESFSRLAETGVEVQEVVDGGVRCRPATLEEADALRPTDPKLELHDIGAIHTDAVDGVQSGLSITLRATSQLDNFPQAKEAFRRAAAVWA